MAKVEIISSCLVGNNIVSSIPRVELISWDLLMLPRNYIEKGLIFQKPQQAAENLIDGLKSSLSRTLEWFPPMAGRLCSSAAADGHSSRFFVECNSAGAMFRHAVAADVSVAEILEAKYTPQVVYSLFPRDGGDHECNIDGLSQPLLAVQVTELADGIFVGCRANHCVVDGGSFWHFINSWAEISRGLDTISKPPVLDRRSCFPGINDDGLLVHVPTVEQNLAPPPSPTAPQKVFRFSRESVGKLKTKANSEAGGGSHRISSLQAVLAHLWRSIERCRGAQEQEPFIVLAAGARARMGPTLPENYFGNAVFVARVPIGKGELLGEKGFGHAALKINEVVSHQTNDVAQRDVEKKVEFPVRRRFGSPPLFIGSSPRYDVYGNDFGWGKPVGVRSGEAQKHECLVVLFPTPEAGGIDVELCLPQEIFEAMESDADFVAPIITN